jgi:hypothetical protein
MAINTFRPHLVALALAIIFACSAYALINAYRDYRAVASDVSLQTARINHLEQQKQELARKQRILKRASQFLATARELGLQQRDWTIYEVNIEKPVSFPVMAQVLNQCANSSAYYFRPGRLDVNVTYGDTAEGAPVPSPAASGQPENAHGDGLLTLRGAFIARNR